MITAAQQDLRRQRTPTLLLLLLLLLGCQSKSSRVLAEKSFDGVTYQLVENIDANIKLTHREWVLRKGTRTCSPSQVTT